MLDTQAVQQLERRDVDLSFGRAADQDRAGLDAIDLPNQFRLAFFDLGGIQADDAAKIAGAVAFLAVLFYVITIVKVGPGVFRAEP